MISYQMQIDLAGTTDPDCCWVSRLGSALGVRLTSCPLATVA
jgi:hypothetical protein